MRSLLVNMLQKLYFPNNYDPGFSVRPVKHRSEDFHDDHSSNIKMIQVNLIFTILI